MTRCTRCRALCSGLRTAASIPRLRWQFARWCCSLLSNAYPLVGIQYNGESRHTTLAGAALSLYRQGHAGLACLVFITTVLSPFLQIAGLLYLLIPLRRGRQAAGLGVFGC